MARRSFSNLDRKKSTWLIIAIALFAISIVLRWPTLVITTIHPSSHLILCYLILVYSCICFLWFRRGPLQNKFVIVLIAVLLPVFDQLIVMLQRKVGAADLFEVPEFAAGELGVWIGWVVHWFIKPYAGIAEKSRREFCKFVVFHALRQRNNFNGIYLRLVPPAICSAFLLSIFPFALDVFIYEVTASQSSFTERMIYTRPLVFASIGGLAGFVFGVSLVWRWAVTKRSKEHQETKPCFKCSESCLDVVFDESGWSTCRKCSSLIHKGQWIAPPRLLATSDEQRSRTQRNMVKMILIGLLPMGLSFAFLLQLESLGFYTIIIFPIVMVIFQIMMYRGIRIDCAYRYDRQHIECRECSYQLKETAIEEGVGICPECGLRFAKFVK